MRKISFGMAIAADPDRAPDPKTLRALAHPLRWKLIDLLGSETTATATRCAEVLGESEASCSYHLRILAKYGYITRAASTESREKPWQLTRPDQNLFPAEPDAGTARAAEAAVEVFLDHEIAKLKSRLRRKSLEPPAVAAGHPAAGHQHLADRGRAAAGQRSAGRDHLPVPRPPQRPGPPAAGLP